MYVLVYISTEEWHKSHDKNGGYLRMIPSTTTTATAAAGHQSSHANDENDDRNRPLSPTRSRRQLPPPPPLIILPFLAPSACPLLTCLTLKGSDIAGWGLDALAEVGR